MINMVRNASVSIVILAYLYISPCKIMVVMEYCMNLITIQWSLANQRTDIHVLNDATQRVFSLQIFSQ